jgi:hypothetical protein
MNIIQKYMCCINNDGHNEMEKVTKEISVSIQNVSTIEVSTMTRTTPTNANSKDDTTNVDDNKKEEEDDFNVVTNEDYGDTSCRTYHMGKRMGLSLVCKG